MSMSPSDIVELRTTHLRSTAIVHVYAIVDATAAPRNP